MPVFLYGILQSNLSVFLKRKNSITGLMNVVAMCDCFFDFISTREVSWKLKSKGRLKCGTMEKLFIIKPMYCFKLMFASD